MTEAMMGFAGLAVLVAAFFVVDLLLAARQRRRIAAGGSVGGVHDRHGNHRAANSARIGSHANTTSSGTYTG